MADNYQIENLEIDLNSLFNLTYNFDLLKQTLEKILKNQNNHSHIMKEMQHKFTEKDNKILEIEERLNKNNNNDLHHEKLENMNVCI
jgi:hypothetical protein